MKFNDIYTQILNESAPQIRTIKELKTALRPMGYVVRSYDGEYEVYPKGHRGPMSYFTDDKQDAYLTAMHEYSNRPNNR